VWRWFAGTIWCIAKPRPPINPAHDQFLLSNAQRGHDDFGFVSVRMAKFWGSRVKNGLSGVLNKPHATKTQDLAFARKELGVTLASRRRSNRPSPTWCGRPQAYLPCR
jgi:hypothetical protein